jgi:hypothetical protein
MKTKIYIIIIAIFIIVTSSKAQEIKIHGNYYLNNSLDLSVQNFKSSLAEESSYIDSVNNSNYILSVQRIDNGRVYFKFWGFKTKNESNKKNAAINGKDNNVIYNMSENDFKLATSMYYDRYEWKVGTFYVPFKLRFNSFSFDSNANIGTNVSCKIRWNRRKENGFAIEPLIGIGLTSISLKDSTNSASTPSNLMAFSWNAGVLWHITDKINIGTIIGLDCLSGNDQQKYHWKYNARPWLGLGINVTFSSENKNSAASDKQD